MAGRIVVLLVVAVGLAAGLPACGDDDDAEVGAGPEAGVLTLEVEGGELASGAPAEWSFTMTNDSGAAVVLTFRSGQDGDVVLRDDADVVYRWSEGQAFTLAIREVTLAPGEVYEFTLTEPSLDVPPGTYELEALVASEPSPEPVVEAVTVD